LPDAGRYAEKHVAVVDTALRSKLALRQAYVISVLAYAGVDPAPFAEARADITKRANKTVTPKLTEWVEGDGGALPWRFDPRS
jgi:hypothetical protein